MSVHIAFYFEDWTQHVGAAEPKTTLHRWRHNMKALGVEKIWMIDSTTFQIGQYYNHQDSEIQFERVSSLELAEAGIPGHFEKVYLEVIEATQDQAGSTNLMEFDHPQDALYVVGRDTSSIAYTAERSGADCHWVHIPMASPHSYYADVAVSITLFHRMCKIDQQGT